MALIATELKSLLQAHGLRLTKRLGQHHLVDPHIVERLVNSFGLSLQDTVVEIGAGLGALTEPLAERAGRVIAVEIDPRVCALLAERMGRFQHVTVVHQDILEFPWNGLKDVIVIGAIPYHITSPILAKLNDYRQAIRTASLIMQKEVASRLVAAPGTKAYGRLSILGQYSWELSRVMTIPRRAFFPQPEVDSTCLRLLPRKRPPVAVDNEQLFFELVKASFAYRRKTLANCLSGQRKRSLLTRAQAQAVLEQLRLPPTVRGEALSLSQFAALSNAVGRLKSLC